MGVREQLADQICDCGALLYDRGFIAGAEGNISCRLSENEILCTPTMISKGSLAAKDLCVVNLVGEQISGVRRRTTEILLHLEIYKNSPQAGAVVHCHPPHATAFAISQTPLPSGVLAEVEYYLQDIPTLEYRTPGTAEFARLIGSHAAKSRCALLKNHGAVSWDAGLEKACWWMEILEGYCRVAFLARQLGPMSSLSCAQIAELRQLAKQNL